MTTQAQDEERRRRAQDEERRRHVEFARKYSEEEYLVLLDKLYADWERCNKHLDGVLKPPHIALGRTAPRSIGHCSATTGYGAPVEFLINEGLAFGTRPAWVVNPGGVGHGRFLADLVGRLTAVQYVQEHLG